MWEEEVVFRQVPCGELPGENTQKNEHVFLKKDLMWKIAPLRERTDTSSLAPAVIFMKDDSFDLEERKREVKKCFEGETIWGILQLEQRWIVKLQEK